MNQIVRVSRALRRVLAIARDSFIRCCFVLLERLLPCKTNYWCFCAWPGPLQHTVDNPRAVFEEIKNDASLVKIVLVRTNLGSSRIAGEGASVVLVEAESLWGAYYLAVSRIVVLGYALIAMSSYSRHLTRKHKIIQLSHGIPLKRIGRLFPPEAFWEKETYKYTAAISSSRRDREIFAAAYSPLAKENVWLTGLPRYDTMFKPEDQLPTDYKRHLEDLRNRLGGRRLVLYAPTWRELGHGMYEFSELEKDQLEALMQRHNSVFAIRAHSNRRSEEADRAQTRSGILFVNDFPDVNVVLRLTDVVVTDYSSIYIDFLLTAKPILHFTYDLKEYENERGFLYDLDEAFAAPPLETFSELLSELARALTSGRGHVARYDNTVALFHEHGEHPAREVVSRIRALP